MTEQTRVQAEFKAAHTAEKQTGETVVGFAILGCLVAGAVGIIKAMSMETGSGVFFCLLASVVAFGGVAYLYLRRE